MSFPDATSTRARPHFRLGYQPALDGVRALALLGVLLYHGGVAWIPGGFLTIDAFFVLSGFLITFLLIREWTDTGGIALGAFWARRARRLLPALLLLLAGIAVYAALFAAPAELSRIRGDWFASFFYVANWRFVSVGESYFDAFVAPSPLRHLWSLAIEEQFYLLWPLIVFGVLRWTRGSLRALLIVCAVVVVVSSLLMAALYTPGGDMSRVYYGTDTRAQSLALGAALSIVVFRWGAARTDRGRAALEVAGTLGFLLVGVLWWQVSERSEAFFSGGFLLYSLAVAAVIAAVVQPRRGWLSRLLAAPPLPWIGQVSYGCYLWHWPIYVVLSPARTGFSGPALLALRVAVSFVFAAVSYTVVERPIRERRLGARATGVGLPLVAGAVAVAILLATSGGTNLDRFIVEPSRASAAPAGDHRVLVQGDSVASFLGKGMELSEADDDFAIWNRARWGCPLGAGTTTRNAPASAPDECADWHGVWANEVDEFDPDVVVILVGVFEIFDRTVDGRQLEFASDAFDDYYLELLDDASDLLSERGAAVLFVASPHPLSSKSYWETNAVWEPSEAWRTEHFHELLRENVRRNDESTTVVDITPEVCPDDPCQNEVDGVPMRIDGLHWTPEGAGRLAEMLAPYIDHAMAKR